MTMVNYVPGHNPASTLSRRDRKKKEVRARLYATAIAIFRRDGFDETPVEAITTAADTAKGTFFNYFPTKEHVLAAYHDDMTGRILGRLEDMAPCSSEDAVQEAMAVCADWVESDRVMGRYVVQKVFGNPVVLSADLRNTELFMNWFRDRIAEGVERGELRSELDVPVMLSMLAAVLSSTMNAWVMRPDAFDLRDLLRRKTRFVFDAARNPQRQRV